MLARLGNHVLDAPTNGMRLSHAGTSCIVLRLCGDSRLHICTINWHYDPSFCMRGSSRQQRRPQFGLCRRVKKKICFAFAVRAPAFSHTSFFGSYALRRLQATRPGIASRPLKHTSPRVLALLLHNIIHTPPPSTDIPSTLHRGCLHPRLTMSSPFTYGEPSPLTMPVAPGDDDDDPTCDIPRRLMRGEPRPRLSRLWSLTSPTLQSKSSTPSTSLIRHAVWRGFRTR